jgi:hypothetical protein
MKKKIEEKAMDDLVDFFKDLVMQEVMLTVAAQLMLKIAKDLDAEEYEGILDQFEALETYPRHAMKPSV